MRFRGPALLVLVALSLGSSCSSQTPSVPASSQPSSTVVDPTTEPPVAATTVRQFNPRWMTLAPLASWTESNRRITAEFQQFGLRPADEDEMPRGCNGCGVDPPTAFLTVYTAGTFDATTVRAGEAVTVNSDGDGYFRAAEGTGDAVLAWQYADDAWATVRGRTTITSRPDRMQELARAIRPTVFTAIHTPLSLPDVPASMPLSEIGVDHGEFGTTLEFSACSTTDLGGTPDCQVESGYLRVQIWPAGRPSDFVSATDAVPAHIGGKDGLYGSDGNSAAVEVQPGLIAVFNLTTSGGSPTGGGLKDILATLSWASDPGNEQTWFAVADWSKPA